MEAETLYISDIRGECAIISEHKSGDCQKFCVRPVG